LGTEQKVGVTVYSAGTKPGSALNNQAVESLNELRMRLVRDDINTRVRKLYAELTGN